MIFFKKLNRINKLLLLIFIICSLLYFFSLMFFTKSIISLSGIETFIRIILLIVFFLLFFMYVLSSLICLFTRKNKTFLSITFLTIIFSLCFSIAAFYIDKTYNKINGLNKEETVYTSVLLSLNDTKFTNNKNNSVGMINDKDDIEGNILAKKLIEKYNLNKIKIEEYDNYNDMIKDLYDKDIEGIFVSSNYSILFGEEDFPTLDDDTKEIYKYDKKISKDEDASNNNKTLTEPFSILLIGVDSTSNNLKANQSFNGDTLMLITFNPNTLNATMFSIPRDTWASISCRNNKKDKINKSAYGGTSCVVETIENLTDVNVDYYVKMNFKGVVDLVNALGGITVDVPKSFCEQNSDREWGSKQICLKKGTGSLNGEQALALARNRHAFVRADFDRVQHQQLIVEAIVKKAKDIRSVNGFYKILDAISNNVDTNMTTDQMLSFYEVGKDVLKNKLNGENDFISIEKTELTGYSRTIDGAYTFQYYKDSINQINNLMKINLEKTKPTLIKTFSFSAKSPYEVKLVGTDVKVSSDEKFSSTETNTVKE